jgi:large subunit ribosomal protein L21
MYAIFETGGKQYKVAAGDRVRVEKLVGEAGDKVKLEKVIAFSNGNALQTGAPYLEASVNATILGAGKGEKVIIFKFKSKKDYRKKQGHRQPYTELEIDNFTVDGKAVGENPWKASTKTTPETNGEPVADNEAPDTAETASAEISDEKVIEAEVVEAKSDNDQDTESTETEALEEIAEKSTESLRKTDIMEKLDELGAEYSKRATKDELLTLLVEAEDKE